MYVSVHLALSTLFEPYGKLEARKIWTIIQFNYEFIQQVLTTLHAAQRIFLYTWGLRISWTAVMSLFSRCLQLTWAGNRNSSNWYVLTFSSFIHNSRQSLWSHVIFTTQNSYENTPNEVKWSRPTGTSMIRYAQ